MSRREVAAAGLQLWATPDPSAQLIARIPAGAGVEVVEETSRAAGP